MVKALVLFSGGLDSRLAIKLLQEQGIEVEAVFFKLPFSKIDKKFLQFKGIKLHIIDCTKGKLLNECLNLIKKPKYGTGAGINPCIDCRIFLLKHAEKLAKKIKADFLATGDVLGERPMSQTSRALKIIDKEIPDIKRPLIKAGVKGRKRDKQIKLAEHFKINYPSPGGGCLLCEKALAGRFKFLLEKNLINEKTLPLCKIGRHFYIDGWFIVGRNEQENKIIEQNKNIIKSGKGKPAVYFHNKNNKNKKTALDLQKAYQLKKPQKFEKQQLK